MDLYEAIARRRDTRAEFTGAPLEPGVLERILTAAHRAPSVGMSQPWAFVTVRDPGTLRTFREHVDTERAVFADSLAGERADTFARIKIEGIVESGLGIVVGYDHTTAGQQVLGRHAIADAGLYSVLAIQHLWLAATAEGVGVGWVSFTGRSFSATWLAFRHTSVPWRGSVSERWPTCPTCRTWSGSAGAGAARWTRCCTPKYDDAGPHPVTRPGCPMCALLRLAGGSYRRE